MQRWSGCFIPTRIIHFQLPLPRVLYDHRNCFWELGANRELKDWALSIIPFFSTDFMVLFGSCTHAEHMPCIAIRTIRTCGARLTAFWPRTRACHGEKSKSRTLCCDSSLRVKCGLPSCPYRTSKSVSRLNLNARVVPDTHGSEPSARNLTQQLGMLHRIHVAICDDRIQTVRRTTILSSNNLILIYYHTKYSLPYRSLPIINNTSSYTFFQILSDKNLSMLTAFYWFFPLVCMHVHQRCATLFFLARSKHSIVISRSMHDTTIWVRGFVKSTHSTVRNI